MILNAILQKVFIVMLIIIILFIMNQENVLKVEKFMKNIMKIMKFFINVMMPVKHVVNTEVMMIRNVIHVLMAIIQQLINLDYVLHGQKQLS